MRLGWRSLCALFIASVWAPGCAASHGGAADGGALAPRQREVASPKVCLAKRRLLEELGHAALAAEADRATARPEIEPELERGPAPPVEVAYGTVAPATVLIRTSEGMGSGVIVDGSGLVLTNHHVVDEFLQPDLTIRVTLELGEVGPTGRMVPMKTAYQGVVVKTDAVKDLALVKIVDPPRKLAVASLAPADPRVGERVLSVGNAGIGLLWAAKVCNVSRVGDLTRETSMLEAGDCSLRDPSDDDGEAKRRREQCEARKAEVKKDVEQSPQGLSIQTTCSLNGGDSGGPLVNGWGEVVGLNQSLRFAGGTLAFHVHVAEMREFLRAPTDGAVAVVPDPFCEGGLEFHVDDFDGDGVIDTASAPSFPHFDGGTVKPQGAYLFDVDQKGAGKKPTAERPFDADVALLLRGGDAYAFYDRDGDGVFDVMLRDKKADGRPELAYRLDGKTAKNDPALLPKATLDPALLPKGAVLARLGAAAAGSGVAKLASKEALASAEVPPIPDVSKTFGKRGYAQDSDDDGKPDMIYGSDAPGHQSILVDVKSPGLSALKQGDEAAPVLDPFRLSPQFVALERASGAWALYDTDSDGTLDLALFAKKPAVDDDRYSRAPDYATHAFQLAPGRAPVALRDPIGRHLVRPDLLRDATAQLVLKRGPGGMSSTRGAFPDPRVGSFGPGEPWKLVALERDRQVLEAPGKYEYIALVDLDGDTKKLSTSAPQDLVGEDKFDAEIAIVRFFDLAWVYYDTNKDGVFDVVLFSRDVSTGRVDNAFRLDPSGEKVTLESVAGPLLRPELVGASARAKAALAELFTRVTTVAPSKE